MHACSCNGTFATYVAKPLPEYACDSVQHDAADRPAVDGDNDVACSHASKRCFRSGLNVLSRHATTATRLPRHTKGSRTAFCIKACVC